MSLLPILSRQDMSPPLSSYVQQAKCNSDAKVPCFDLITITLQLLDFFFQIRFVLFFLVNIFCVIDLCHTLSSSTSQHPELCKSKTS